MDKERIDFLKKDFLTGFSSYCGFKIDRIESGEMDTLLRIRPEHLQQDGFVHAGVMASLADHTAGYASFSTVSDNHRILTIEFKMNYFKPCMGDTVVCRAKVIQNGKKIKVVESEIFSSEKGVEKLVAKGIFTQMAVPAIK
ncbi:MAG: PaaI family thioesterase [Desulfobacterales bacterium]